MLLESFATLESRADAIPVAYREVRLRDAIERIINLYDAWHAAEPGKGYDARAAEWRAKMSSEQASPAEKKESHPDSGSE